ncbi:MAG: phosphohistidine phosphatase SixA [Candidatus Eiseniibacteriota bacterium]|jgi:phosphohistidine phosphatase
MQLHLMRHGIAVPPEAWSGPENERPLTPRGTEELRRAAAGLAALGITFDLIASSPYQRAVETARIVASALEIAVPVEECPALCPGARLESVLRFLEPFADRGSLLVVGHMPDLATMALGLMGCASAPGMLFGQGAVCSLELDGLPPARGARLDWLLPPAHLAAIAGARD